MKDKIKFFIDNHERILIINSLKVLKEYLIEQSLSTDSVEEIILKISDKSKLELDNVDGKIVIKSLYEMRSRLKDEGKSYEDVDNILLKTIDNFNKKDIDRKDKIR